MSRSSGGLPVMARAYPSGGGAVLPRTVSWTPSSDWLTRSTPGPAPSWASSSRAASVPMSAMGSRTVDSAGLSRSDSPADRIAAGITQSSSQAQIATDALRPLTTVVRSARMAAVDAILHSAWADAV